mmetsp:Transcript_3784/g.6664  ORF Transcript_3784/g.6664 Transcript_3784/m.6664 type:complete len:307 (+) Transcript_3784:1338-2258(+)
MRRPAGTHRKPATKSGVVLAIVAFMATMDVPHMKKGEIRKSHLRTSAEAVESSRPAPRRGWASAGTPFTVVFDDSLYCMPTISASSEGSSQIAFPSTTVQFNSGSLTVFVSMSSVYSMGTLSGSTAGSSQTAIPSTIMQFGSLGSELPALPVARREVSERSPMTAAIATGWLGFVTMKTSADSSAALARATYGNGPTSWTLPGSTWLVPRTWDSGRSAGAGPTGSEANPSPGRFQVAKSAQDSTPVERAVVTWETACRDRGEDAGAALLERASSVTTDPITRTAGRWKTSRAGDARGTGASCMGHH